jgi:hypothetical protein
MRLQRSWGIGHADVRRRKAGKAGPRGRVSTAMPRHGRLPFLSVAVDAAIQRNRISGMRRMEPIRRPVRMVREGCERLEVAVRVEKRLLRLSADTGKARRSGSTGQGARDPKV